MARSTLKKPSYLRTGSTIALVAPSFHFPRLALDQGRDLLHNQFHVKTVLLEGVYDTDHYFSGNDQRREAELLHWFLDKSVQAIVMIRGGYGMTRILQNVIKKLKSVRGLKPKIVVAYSDLTPLLNSLYQDLGWVSFHGPAVASRVFSQPEGVELSYLERALFSNAPLGEISTVEMRAWVEGKAKAPLVGGNLSLVNATIGTPYEIKTDGKILFLEDVTEKTYRVDRLLTQLIHAGKLDRVKGVVLGEFTECGTPEDLQWMFKNTLVPFLKKKKIPLVWGFPAGHGKPQITFPIGTMVEIKASNKNPSVTFVEAATVR